MGIRQTVLESLNKAGVDLTKVEVEDIDLREYLEDSFLFISFVVELEEALNIELPAEMLVYDEFSSLNEVCQRLEIFCMPSK